MAFRIGKQRPRENRDIIGVPSMQDKKGNPERGWNDPPVFNFNPNPESGHPRRLLNKRVAFPLSGTIGNMPGYAVLNAGMGPPIMNPVLASNMCNEPLMPAPEPIPIGLNDTPLGNQAPSLSSVQLLPPTADTSTPQLVPLLVPGLLTACQPQLTTGVLENGKESLEEFMKSLSLACDEDLLDLNMKNFLEVLGRYKGILTMKVNEETKKKLELFEDRWKKYALSDLVKIRITQLSQALVNEETDRANHLHLTLMVDHITEVSQWMMAIKRLVHQQQLAYKEKEFLTTGKMTELSVESKDVTEFFTQSKDDEIETNNIIKDDLVMPSCQHVVDAVDSGMITPNEFSSNTDISGSITPNNCSDCVLEDSVKVAEATGILPLHHI